MHHKKKNNKILNIKLLKGRYIFFLLIISTINITNPVKKKYAADSFLYSPKTLSPSKELNGKKNNPIKNKTQYVFLNEILYLFI